MVMGGLEKMSNKLANRCKKKNEETLKNLGMSRLVPPNVVPAFMIPDFDPYQKSLERAISASKRRAWRNGIR